MHHFKMMLQQSCTGMLLAVTASTRDDNVALATARKGKAQAE